ncbi:MAG: hypothetical protein R2857_12485 [Vampirovibrionales bacterium]
MTVVQVPSSFEPTRLRRCSMSCWSSSEETGDVQLPITDMGNTMACHSSVRAGDVLNMEQMQRIVVQWKASQRPWTCPHGRPVSRLLSHQDIMAFFDRPSLPVS